MKAKVFSPYVEVTGATGLSQEGEGEILIVECGGRTVDRQDCRQQMSAERLLRHRTPKLMVCRIEADAL